MNILLMDTETTGLNPKKSYIISNGSILYNDVTKEYSEFYEELNWDLIFSNFIIPEDTIKVHGITQDRLTKDGLDPIKSMSNFYKWIVNFCKENEEKGDSSCNSRLNTVVAFNLSYDLNMFISNLKFLSSNFCNNSATNDENRDNVNKLLDLFTKEYSFGLVNVDDPNSNKPLFIDSLIIDRIFNFEVDGEKVYHDLQSVGERYGIPEDPNAHNAIADTRRTFEVFKIQINEVKENQEDFDQNFENRLIRRYNRNQSYWKKVDGLDYLANKMCAVTGGVVRSEYN